MTQQFNLPPGMVEAAAKALWDDVHPHGPSFDEASPQDVGSYKQQALAALQAALEWAVKEGWAREAVAVPWTDLTTGATGFTADTAYIALGEGFPAILLRLEEPKP